MADYIFMIYKDYFVQGGLGFMSKQMAQKRIDAGFGAIYEDYTQALKMLAKYRTK